MGRDALDLADDVKHALDDAGVLGAFEALAPSHQREYVRWIEDAKRPETRTRRIAQAVIRIRAGSPTR